MTKYIRSATALKRAGPKGKAVFMEPITDAFRSPPSSLIYADDIKVRLLNYIYTTLLFSDASVDFNIVSWNRYILSRSPIDSCLLR